MRFRVRALESLSIAIALFGAATSASADYWTFVIDVGNACDVQADG